MDKWVEKALKYNNSSEGLKLIKKKKTLTEERDIKKKEIR